MSVGVNKSGVVNAGSFVETNGANILNGTRYTKSNPYTLTGTSNDIYNVANSYAHIVPGKIYYLTAQCNPGWADGHGYTEAHKGKGTIWLYLSKTYDHSSLDYDSPICFNTSNQQKTGVWKYTIPTGYNMARVRVNTYADGTNSVTAKFWDFNLIPAEYWTDGNNAIGKFTDDSIVMDNFIEM